MQEWQNQGEREGERGQIGKQPQRDHAQWRRVSPPQTCQGPDTQTDSPGRLGVQSQPRDISHTNYAILGSLRFAGVIRTLRSTPQSPSLGTGPAGKACHIASQ
eukprot:7434422-Pyramimonas_sp.AAC.1